MRAVKGNRALKGAGVNADDKVLRATDFDGCGSRRSLDYMDKSLKTMRVVVASFMRLVGQT